SIIDKVLDRADGVPFVLEQIVLSIEDSINLVPQSVQSVIHARLNRLSSSARSARRSVFAMPLSLRPVPKRSRDRGAGSFIARRSPPSPRPIPTSVGSSNVSP